MNLRTLIVLSLVACTGALTGCTSSGSADNCTKFKAAITQAQTIVSTAQAALVADQQVIAALPPTDPIRKATESHIPQAQAYLAEAQVGLTLVQVAAAAACPNVVVVPVVPVAPTTAPSK